jgi:DNA-binding transcriptional regulator YdaS (Cro superfamily)
MNRNTLIVGALALVSLALIAVGVSQLSQGQGGAAQAPAGPTPTIAQVKRISVQDLNIKLRGANPPLVWELRSVEAFAGGHLPGAQAVQLADIPMLAQKLDPKKSIVTLCA